MSDSNIPLESLSTEQLDKLAVEFSIQIGDLELRKQKAIFILANIVDILRSRKPLPESGSATTEINSNNQPDLSGGEFATNLL